jgi:hypothetical protein
MTTIDAGTSVFGHVVIRYANLAGALVYVFETEPVADHPVLKYWARCDGCLMVSGGVNAPDAINSVREWAVKHSAACRALPQPGNGPAESGKYLSIAATLFDRANRHATSDDGRPLSMTGDEQATVNTLSLLAGAAVRLAESFGRIELKSGPANG